MPIAPMADCIWKAPAFDRIVDDTDQPVIPIAGDKMYETTAYNV